MMGQLVTQGPHTYGYSFVSPPRNAVAPNGGAGTTTAPAGEGKPSPLFANGQFVGHAALTDPSTLAALFQLNDDGTVKVSNLGSPVTKTGVLIESPQDAMTKFLMLGPESTWTEADRAVAADLSKITDEDKALFRSVTGYNLFISGPAMLMVDDMGNAPSPPDAAAADELFQRIRFARETNQAVDSEWFNAVADDIEAWKGPAFPTEWRDKAEAWFDDLLASHQVESGQRNSADFQIPKAVLPPADLSSALEAYEGAARLSHASA